MGNIRGILLTFLLLLLNDIKESSSFQFNKECYVKDTHVFKWEEHTFFNVSFFVTSEDSISFQITFEGRNDDQDNDLLILEPSKGTLQRKRKRVASTEDIILKHNIPIGWNRMNISSHGNELHIGNFYTLTDIGYKIFDITVSAKYLTLCADSTPIWKIKSLDQVSVPLQDLSSIRIRLASDQSFTPKIKLFAIDIPLSYNGELAIGKSNMPLPPQDYKIEILKNKSLIYISTSTKTNEHKTLMIANIEEILVNLIIGTASGSFYLELDPFFENIAEQKTENNYQDMRIKGSTTTSSNIEEVINAVCEDKSQSCTVWHWQAVAGIASVIAVISIIITVGPDRLRKMTRKHQVLCVEGDMEEGDTTLPLLKKEQKQETLKNHIKSEYCKAHGELNIQMDKHDRVICKLKLKNEENNTSKKNIGNLNDNKPRKVILVIGQTGSGKSSFINTMVNFIYGIKYDDPFRFKLIDDTDGPNVDVTNRTNEMYVTNRTNEITAYYLPHMDGIEYDCNYIFIDTPGFKDSGGIQEDKDWNQKLYEFLKLNSDIGAIDGLCFVAKATDTRLTDSQKYIIDSLFSKFGKDINNSIYAIISYSDGSESHVPELLIESGLNHNLAIYFNSNGLYNDKKIVSSIHEKAEIILRDDWDRNMRNIDAFFKFIRTSTAVSLSLTSIVLEENKDIEKLKDEILELRIKEDAATDQEKQDIQSRIEENQELLMIKLDEAEKLSGRLENIPAKKNPLVINKYIDVLIKSEQNKDKIIELQKLKDRNTAFQKFMKEKTSTKSLVKMILGEKTEKTE